MVDYTLLGIQAGNMDDTGTMVEMESLYLYSVAHNKLKALCHDYKGRVLLFLKTFEINRKT